MRMNCRFFAVLPLLLVALLLLSGGCATSYVESRPVAPGTTTLRGEPVQAELVAGNNGLFLFYWIPIVSGASTRPNRHDYDFFENQVAPNYAYRMLDDYSHRIDRRGKVEDIVVQERCSGWLGLGIFWQRSVRAKALLVGVPRSERESEKEEDSLF